MGPTTSGWRVAGGELEERARTHEDPLCTLARFEPQNSDGHGRSLFQRRARRLWHHPGVARGTRLLIATGESAASATELPALIRAFIDSASDVLVMTPILAGALQWLVSDTDRARYEADVRLSSVLGDIEELAPQAEVRGQIGDETPLTAFADATGQFQPDHILLALRGSQHSGWQEHGLTDAIRKNFHIPITVFEIDRTDHVPPDARG
jgi:hypothetical protein